jgi:hypothetical protein
MTAAQVAEVLRELIDAKRPIRLVDPRRPWVQVAVGEVAFQSGDLGLVFYADSASLDHVVSVQRAGGEKTGFADWLRREGADPVALLDDSERVALEQVLTETS